ncbi:hypothetical protein [Bradyrhizobium zhanjiangense]|uniref:Uncharacterized protein n=1 Tax=Bradyrhizobium zhanjiangense TaxID=1325107 RepID=A0ABY0DKC2_9BRAD|nr:hypothetical protein [Bradyrhizobium zhanjiangense]RXG93037.1 hypothetical protein EAS62_20280 [Bradyrhizobium zhanjiangense]
MIFNKSKSAALSARIDTLDKEIAAGAVALADLQTRRREAIRDGDDAAAGKFEESMATAERKAVLQAERRDILAAEHENALADEAREEFARRHAAQQEANAKVAAAAQKALRKAWDVLAQTLRELAEARAATDLLNKAAPGGFSQLPYADDLARGALALPRVDISTKTVELWCFASTGNRVADQDAVQGGSLLAGFGALKPQPCVKRRFHHVRYHPAEDPRYAAPISTDLRFPRWDSAGPLFDGASVIPDGVAAALSTIEANQKGKAARPILEEFIAIDDTASDAA